MRNVIRRLAILCGLGLFVAVVYLLYRRSDHSEATASEPEPTSPEPGSSSPEPGPSSPAPASAPEPAAGSPRFTVSAEPSGARAARDRGADERGFINLPLSRRDRRALTLGAVAAIAILGYAFVLRPIGSEAAELQARQELGTQVLARYEGVLEARPVFQARHDSARTRLAELRDRVFSAADPGRSVSSLLEIVGHAADGSSVRIMSASPLRPDSIAPGISRISASVQAESDLRGTLELLRALERAEKLLHVTGLRISALGANTGPMETLRIDFTARGYVISQDDEEEPDVAAAP